MKPFFLGTASLIEWAVVAFACLTAVGFPGCAGANDVLVIELAAEVGRLAKRKVVPLPEVSVVEDAEIFAHCRCKAHALFVDGGVLMSSQVDLATGAGKAILVHELVHGIQHDERGLARDCEDWLARESEAMAIERRWRVDHGVRLPPPPMYRCINWR